MKSFPADTTPSNDYFRIIAQRVSEATGTSWAFFIALAVLIIWGITGPLFQFSDTWQLVINTATTIITFLMVFLIQNTQNRDSRAMQLKLDELIRAIHPARNQFLNLEELSDSELKTLQQEFHALHESAMQEIQKRAAK